jgi:signal peptide peptidase SppA
VTMANEQLQWRLDAMLARPVLLDPRALDAVRAGSGIRLASSKEATPSSAPFERDGNVAVVTIRGLLAQRAWQEWLFSGDGYDAIEGRVRTALDDRQVSAILMRIDSPGGEVAGCFEAVRSIRKAATAAGKVIVCYVDEMACSAAYALATAADEIVVPNTGMVGSVGVIATVLDRSEQLARNGTKIHVIVSGQAKADGHPAIPLADDARKRLQAEVDYLAGIFADVVAKARGMTPAAVLGQQAAVYLGPGAVKAKLADHVGGYRVALERAKTLKGKTMDATRALVSRSAVQAAFEAPQIVPTAMRWEQLTNQQKHDLAIRDRALFDRLRAEHQRSGR